MAAVSFRRSSDGSSAGEPGDLVSTECEVRVLRTKFAGASSLLADQEAAIEACEAALRVQAQALSAVPAQIARERGLAAAASVRAAEALERVAVLEASLEERLRAERSRAEAASDAEAAATRRAEASGAALSAQAQQFCDEKRIAAAEAERALLSAAAWLTSALRESKEAREEAREAALAEGAAEAAGLQAALEASRSEARLIALQQDERLRADASAAERELRALRKAMSEAEAEAAEARQRAREEARLAELAAELELSTSAAEAEVLELRAEVERKASLIELYQSRDNPRERFSPCVGEIKAVQRRLSAEAVEAAGELQAARAALEDSEERAASRRAELEARLESARQDAFHAQTQGQAARPSPPQQSVGCAKERELRCALSQLGQLRQWRASSEKRLDALSAECAQSRAEAENAASQLAAAQRETPPSIGHQNPKQRIRYTERIKREAEAVRRERDALSDQLAAANANAARLHKPRSSLGGAEQRPGGCAGGDGEIDKENGAAAVSGGRPPQTPPPPLLRSLSASLVF
ncbi:hypothetical protein EMIHUDRAFT_223858 [Emiliania huxleyi CCMP1516]|uniref:Uncharacterized protein n=2 Tax=Emiliania huxleyi TaxID=2903 RepID=A0A0D3KTC5_EMIH1|nr:hypothetical protein EMIHUDRAFT_223858 [Emiliania huxleyi CCMP1516]EOD39010.1 hypothetical protein EMIHUDRAFT_223858 [Emiliania huxleyi CCMP1516]|eukprot:XP_005791439.1 hypothetical protein EMIHUDRAFT_223858 [Emiliania huxleyi CCMP1516]